MVSFTSPSKYLWLYVPSVAKMHTIKLKKTEEETITREKWHKKNIHPKNCSFVSRKICVLPLDQKEEKEEIEKKTIRFKSEWICVLFFLGLFILSEHSGFSVGFDFLTVVQSDWRWHIFILFFSLLAKENRIKKKRWNGICADFCLHKNDIGSSHWIVGFECTWVHWCGDQQKSFECAHDSHETN